jgi:hypothetical protein
MKRTWTIIGVSDVSSLKQGMMQELLTGGDSLAA